MRDFTVGNLITSYRTRLGLKQHEVANPDDPGRLSVALRTYQGWENGERIPPNKWLRRIASFFHLTDAEADELYRAAAQVAPEIENLPFQRNPFFTGRETYLERLEQYLKENSSVAITQPITISGLGGIGKTQLALEYAHRNHSALYRAVLWVNAETIATLQSSYISLARQLELPEKNDCEIDYIVQAVKTWLAEHRGWLLILDNADDLKLIRSFLPAKPRGHVLLTTRSQILGNSAVSFAIEALEPDEGLLFLLRRSGLLSLGTEPDILTPDVQNAAMQIAKLLGGHPLALDQAGAFIEETGCSLVEYMQLFQEQRRYLLERRGILGDEHPETVVVTLELCFQQAGKICPKALDMLNFCSILYPENIPEVLLKQNSDFGMHVLEMNEAIAALRRYSLIKRNIEKNEISMHRLVQSVLRDALSAEIKKRCTEQAIIALHSVLNQELSHWSQFDTYLPHALACTEMIRQEEVVSLKGVWLLLITGDGLGSRSRYTEAEELYQQALAIQGQLAQPEPLDRALLLQRMADLSRRQDKYIEAESLIHQSVHIYSSSSLESLSNLQYQHFIDCGMIAGRIYWQLDEYPAAEGFFQLSLAQQMKLSNQFDIKIARMLTALAEVYLDQDKYLEAETLLRQALTICEQQQKPKQFITATCCAVLASACKNLKKLEEAEILLLRAISLMREYYGRDHLEIGIVINNLALLYHEQGRYTEAEPLYNQALAMREQYLGPLHTQVAQTLGNLGGLYYDLGQYDKAISLIGRALAIQEQRLGSSHTDVAVSLDNLANVYMMDQSKYNEAEQLLHRALVIWEQKLGPNHSDTLACLLRLAALYAKQGRYAEEEPVRQRILTIREHLPGSQPRDLGISLINLSDCYTRQEKYEQAEPIVQKALSLFEESPDIFRQERIQSISCLFWIYIKQNKMEEAERVALQIKNDDYKILSSLIGNISPEDNL